MSHSAGRRATRAARPLMRPSRVFVQVNERCDSRCRLCDYWLIDNPAELDMGDLRDTVVPLLEPLSPLLNISITGGEPTLHPDLVQICSTLRPLAHSLTLVTSTTGLPEVFADLRSLVSAYLISIDGVDRRTYVTSRGIDHAAAAVEWLSRIRQETEAEIGVSCVIQRANHDRLVTLVEICLSAGAHHVFLRVPSLTDDAFGRQGTVALRTLASARLTEEQVALVAEQLTELAARYTAEQLPNAVEYDSLISVLRGGKPGEGTVCDVPFTSFVVTPNGTYSPCFYLPFSAPASDPGAVAELVDDIRGRMLHDKTFRARHCDGCHQFTGRRMDATDILAAMRRQWAQAHLGAALI